MEITHALSFDIEDWFHIVEIKASEDPADWPGFESIVRKRTREILDIVKTARIRATFFILGWIAETYPDVVRMIADDGHELGTHSFWHRKVYDLTPETFREDLARSIDVIERAAGVKVYGFRAPSFSIIPGTEWAFEVIKDVGLTYDASLFPARRAHGGYPCQQGPHLVEWSPGNSLPELPMSVMNLGPLRFGFSGGGYFRILPLWLIERGIRKELNQGRPTVIYLHPRDFATDCPNMPMPPHRRFKCYVGRKKTAQKLIKLVSRYPFSTCYDVMQQHSLLPANAKTETSDIAKDARP